MLNAAYWPSLFRPLLIFFVLVWYLSSVSDWLRPGLICLVLVWFASSFSYLQRPCLSLSGLLRHSPCLIFYSLSSSPIHRLCHAVCLGPCPCLIVYPCPVCGVCTYRGGEGSHLFATARSAQDGDVLSCNIDKRPAFCDLWGHPASSSQPSITSIEVGKDPLDKKFR